MSNEQSIRDELAATIHENFNACRGRNGVNPHLLADEILASPVIRRIQAEALRAHAKAVSHWERGHSPRIMSHSVERIVADLNDRADRIERGETA